MTDIDDVAVTGDETQNAIGNTVSRDLIMHYHAGRGRGAMNLAEGEIGDRVADYVPARNHGLIVDVLRRERVIMLAGPAGAGVTTTAIATSRDVHPGMPVRPSTIAEEDTEEDWSAGCAYLVRAADEGDQKDLRSRIEVVSRKGRGLLLVVGTEAELSRFAGACRTVVVEPPPAGAVYRRRLAVVGLGDTGWPDWPRAAELLKGASPGDARRLAELVKDIGDEQEVERAYLGWDGQLRDWFTEYSGLRDQTLLIAAAAIAPADESSVYGAALSLARHLQMNVEGGGLAWRPSTGLTELLGADRVDDRLVFRRHGYAPSVLRHVCAHYPLARTDLLAWLSGLPTDDAVVLDAVLRRRTTEVFADLAADNGFGDWILEAARAWADHRRADFAFIVLARTCLHPVVGGQVRTRLYEWSRDGRRPQTLKLTIARVCQVLGRTDPSVAMTRLKHLATHGDVRVRDEVTEAALEVARFHEEEVFAAALGWCRAAAGFSLDSQGAGLAGVALRILLDRLANSPDGGPSRLHDVLGAIARLAVRGDAVRSVALEAALQLAAGHRAAVVQAALAWADLGADPAPGREQLALFGAALFLELAAERDSGGLALILTGPGAVDPLRCVPAWSLMTTVEIGTEAGYGGFPDLVMLWLDTAEARPDLCPRIVSLIVMVAEGNPARRELMVDFVRAWAGSRRDRRDIREDVLMRLLLPEWQRLLLVLWVRLRRKVIGGG
ncbi:hypothetical protein [Actinomadura chokoriensis]|uniref:hypothetical protein n=1 Tax=Actinomadura chokoriensis TaxID=454156 RepID=UPI0031F971BB